MTGGLNPLECAELQELWLGAPSNMKSLFADRAELQAAWEKHRTVLMVMFARGGRRPAIWWELAAPAGLRFDKAKDNERSVLWRAGILGAEEKRELEVEWQAEFERAYSLGYDAKGRRKHFRFCDIPSELVRAWSAARRRSGRRIRALEREVASKPAA
jgi:hypothetical protein